MSELSPVSQQLPVLTPVLLCKQSVLPSSCRSLFFPTAQQGPRPLSAVQESSQLEEQNEDGLFT